MTINQEILAHLQATVRARLEYWKASEALELVLGYTSETIPDAISDAIYDTVGWLAAGSDNTDLLGQEHVDFLLKEIQNAQ